MKKIILISILFLLTSSAFSSNVFRLRKFHFNSTPIGMGNDRWSNGFSRNMDDQKTYSLSFGMDYNAFFINADIDAMTAKDFNSRYDLMTVYVGIPFDITDYSSWCVRAGLTFYGNLFLEKAQNMLHQTMNIYQVSAQYPYKEKKFPFFGIYADAHYTFRRLNFALYADFDIKSSFSADEEFGARIDLDTFSFFVGYRFMQKFYNDMTLGFWVNRRKGYQTGYSVNKGTLSLHYFINPVTHQGYGEFKVNLFADYKKSAFKYSLGKMWYYMSMDGVDFGFEHFNTLEIKLYFLYFSTHFNTGDRFNRPMDNGIFSVGLAIKLPFGFVIKPNVKYSRFMYQSVWIKDCHIGFGAEVMYGRIFFENYKVNLIFSLNWIIDKALAPGLGFNLELV